MSKVQQPKRNGRESNRAPPAALSLGAEGARFKRGTLRREPVNISFALGGCRRLGVAVEQLSPFWRCPEGGVAGSLTCMDLSIRPAVFGEQHEQPAVKQRLFVFIGGADEQNGDYSLVHRLARRGGTANWSSLKESRPGDRALIYIQQPHSALIAKAEVLAEAKKGKPGDYAYRARTGHFELLPNRVGLQDLKRQFPRWAWLRQPRGKAIVPARYADRLWKLVHEKNTTVQILISNAGQGKSQLDRMADTGRSEVWSVPKLTAARAHGLGRRVRRRR